MTKPPASATPSTERRPMRRNRVLMAGIISSADGNQNFKCIIRDVNDTGARIFVRGQQVPSDFYLIHVRDRIAYDAKIIWHRGTEVGVSFQRTFRLADVREPALQFLTRLWFNELASS
jgi:hypothetical protein